MASDNRLLTEDELWKLENVSDSAVQFYFSLAEKYLADTIDVGKHIDQKGFILITGYLVVFVGYFSLLDRMAVTGPWFKTAMILLIIGTGFLAAIFKPRYYGVDGMKPSAWLRAGAKHLTAKNEDLTRRRLYALRRYVDRIEAGRKSNKVKRGLLNLGLSLGIASIFLVIALFTFHPRL